MAKKDWMVKLSDLDDLQTEIFYADLDKSGIVSGCAGSGKSVLALLKAQRIQQEKGNDCQIIVYTKALNHFMEKGKKVLGLNIQFYYHEEWKWKKIMKYYGRKGFLPVYDKDQFGDKIPNKPSSQYIIVDEIQDFSVSEIQEFLAATQCNFYFFGDTAQSLYGRLKGGNTIPVNQIKHQILHDDPNVKEWELWQNHRLPIPVALLAQEIGVGLKPFDPNIYTSKETALPRVIEYDSLEDQLQAICRIIKNGNLDDVSILLPESFLVKEVYQKLKNMVNDIHFEVRYNEQDEDTNNSKPYGEDTLNFDTTNPKIMTYHSAKGLQFETVILPYLDCFNDDPDVERRTSLYVAITRTYRNLYLLYTENAMPGILSRIANKGLWESTEIDQIEDK